MFVHSLELRQSNFTESSEVLNSINMVMQIGKFIFAVLSPIMLILSVIYQSIIDLKSICIKHCTKVCVNPNYGHQFTQRYTLDNTFSFSTTTSDTSNTASSKMAFVKLYSTGCKRTFSFQSSAIRSLII